MQSRFSVMKAALLILPKGAERMENDQTRTGEIHGVVSARDYNLIHRLANPDKTIQYRINTYKNFLERHGYIVTKAPEGDQDE